MSLTAATLTFLFTDIEGSTRRWEADADRMRLELEAHDAVLREVVAANGGHLFKHTGDGICARFSSPAEAIAAAVAAQRLLQLPVRMGLATGEAIERDGDYFGPVLNLTARVMSAGHGGQILVAGAAPADLDGVSLLDLGERRLRDLTDLTRIYQVRADGLVAEFPPLRTVDLSPGNLPVQVTSFLGRDLEVKLLAELVRANRLLTLTGPGGVGKTRVALQVAAELVTDFPDGVWLVELAPLSSGDAVAEAVATVLKVTTEPQVRLEQAIGKAIGDRRLLLVLDNAEHLLDATAELVRHVLASTTKASVLLTSREGLRLSGEHLWPVPPLDISEGIHSTATELLIERAREVDPSFTLAHHNDIEAAVEICRRLDGLPLAIELAAARLLSMNVREVRDRLNRRFRLLTSTQHGQGHHQTLHQTLQWSYDLLQTDERALLDACAVFAGGFDLEAASLICTTSGTDELDTLDTLDSLVRKSLLTVERVGDRTRFGMLESVRQFALDRLTSAALTSLRDSHADYFGGQSRQLWESMWNGPGYRQGVNWVDTEFDNLRAGFRWSTEQGRIESASRIASHTAMLAFALQRYEPIGWAEEVLAAATTQDIAELPRLYSAAGLCTYVGRPNDAVGYANHSLTLEADPRYDPFEAGWTAFFEAIGHRFAGRVDQYVAIAADMAAQTGLVQLVGRCALIFALPLIGRSEEAMQLAEPTLTDARERGNPFIISWALNAYGRAFTEQQPQKALEAFREGLDYTREFRVPFWETNIARDAAALEAAHGERTEALEMFESTINSFHRTGNTGHAAASVANLAIFFARIDKPAIAATLYGACQQQPSINMVIGLQAAIEQVATRLGPSEFHARIEEGQALIWSDTVTYALRQIYLARAET
ncbi:MAG: ATP-binding protein [Acidimicrobiales bacterium]